MSADNLVTPPFPHGNVPPLKGLYIKGMDQFQPNEFEASVSKMTEEGLEMELDLGDLIQRPGASRVGIT